MSNYKMSDIKIKKFSMESIEFKINGGKSPIIYIIGDCPDEKKCLVKDLLYYHQEIPIGTVITSNEQPFYEEFIPKVLIHAEYNPIIIENILKRQCEVFKQIKKEEARFKKSNIDPRTFVVMDDCLYDNELRDANTMIILNTSYLSSFSKKGFRENIDYVFIFKQFSVENYEILYTNYGSIFPTFEIFCQVLDEITENNGCIVIYKNVTSNQLEDNVFWYKANTHEGFKAVNKEFWEMNDFLC